MPLSVGDKLGPYQILAPTGKGGMGEVYRAHDPRLKRDVAIKVSGAQFSERFEREALQAAVFLFPGIVGYFPRSDECRSIGGIKPARLGIRQHAGQNVTRRRKLGEHTTI